MTDTPVAEPADSTPPPPPFEPGDLDLVEQGWVTVPRALLQLWAGYYVLQPVEPTTDLAALGGQALDDLERLSAAARPAISAEPLAEVTPGDLTWLVGYLASLSPEAPLPPHLRGPAARARAVYDPSAYVAVTAAEGDKSRAPLTDNQVQAFEAVDTLTGPDKPRATVREVSDFTGIDRYAIGQALQALRRKELVAELHTWNDDAGRALLHYSLTDKGRARRAAEAAERAPTGQG